MNISVGESGKIVKSKNDNSKLFALGFREGKIMNVVSKIGDVVVLTINNRKIAIEEKVIDENLEVVN